MDDSAVGNMKTSSSYAAFLKSPESCLKHSTYFHAYDSLFEEFRGKPITFVEIGVLNGGSLFMWRDFFGPDARIIGIDLNPGAKKWEEHGFEIHIGSQEDLRFWDVFCADVGMVDIVLDDGGHTYLQQIITTEVLLDHINDGGMLVVEDTHTSYMDNFGDKRASFMTYVTQFMHRINSRFGKFSPEQTDTRVWSLEIFESIVAFKVNRVKSALKSTPERNKMPQAENAAADFRHHRVEMSDDIKQRTHELLADAFKIY